MKNYEYDLSVSRNPKNPEQIGTPHLLYVSSWEQTITTLPRSLHSHPDFAEFTLILAGQGVCELDGVFYPIAKGDLIIYNRGILHDEFVDSHPIALVSIAADNIQLPGLPENCILPSDTVPLLNLGSNAPAFSTLVTLLIDTVKSTNARRDLTSQAIFLALFYLLLDTIDVHCHKASAGTDPVIGLAHQIRSYVDIHVTEELSVAEIAAHFAISPSYLARIFKHTIGCPLSKYIIRRRMGEAQSLLLNTSLPISVVAERVGYPNQSYFTKLFTQSFHISPLQYRKISGERLINLPEQ